MIWILIVIAALLGVASWLGWAALKRGQALKLAMKVSFLVFLFETTHKNDDQSG